MTNKSWSIAAVIIGSTGLVISIAALLRNFTFGLQLGDLGTWIGGLGTTMVAILTLWTVRESIRARTGADRLRAESDREAGVRALRKAARARVTVLPGNTTGTPAWTVTLQNNTGGTLYDVEWTNFTAVQAPTAMNSAQTVSTTITDFPFGADEHPSSPVVLDTEARTAHFFTDETTLASYLPRPEIEFTDEDGYRFRYVEAALPGIYVGAKGKWISAEG